MKLEFYKCAKCGDVVVKVFDGKGSECCGDDRTRLEAGVTDAAREKHVPVVTANGDAIHVEVGSVLHPMEENHYITMIVLETSQGFQVKQLHPGEEPKADFTLNPGDSAVAVYEYCNLHGLWKTEL